MALERTTSRPGPVLGHGQPHHGRDADADGHHQCAAAPVARDDERERDQQHQPHRQDRPLACEHLARELPCASTPVSPLRVPRRWSTGRPASEGRRRRGSGTRGPRRPTRPGARRRPACPASSRLTPTSTTAAPGLTISAVTMCGTPTAAMTMSASPRELRQVPGRRVAQRNRRVLGPPREQQPHRTAHRHASPDHHDVRAGDLDLEPAQQMHDAPRGARQWCGLVEHQPAEVGGVQPVGVLARIDTFERGVLVEVLRQRQLHDVPGALGVGVELVDGLVERRPG